MNIEHNHPAYPCFRIGDTVRVQGDRATAKIREILVKVLEPTSPFFQGVDANGIMREYENRNVVRVIPHDCPACTGVRV